MNSSLLIQKQVRDNSSDVHAFVNELNKWEDEMKRKEAERGDGNKEEELPPIRSKIIRNTSSSKPKRIPSYDYSAWDKLDIDKELEKIDCPEQDMCSSSKSTEPIVNMKERMDLAYAEKNKGNSFVKEQKWGDAILCYSNAIANFPSDPIFYANRALCYLKLKEFTNCEIDCTNALKLDSTYVKALHRRATARIQLNQNEEALHDLKKVIELEPKNIESLKELQKLEKKLNLKTETKSSKKVSPIKEDIPPPSTFSKETEVLLNDWPEPRSVSKSSNVKVPLKVETDGSIIKPITKPPNLRSKKPLKRIEVLEIDCDEDYLEYKRLNTSNKNLNEVLWEQKTINEKEKLSVSLDQQNDDPVLSAVNLANEFTVPKTCLQFESQWKKCKDFTQKNAFLSMMPIFKLPGIFSEFLESSLFSQILEALSHSDDVNVVLDYLIMFPKVKRFSTLILFATDNDKKYIAEMLSSEGMLKMLDSEVLLKSEINSLKQAYGLEM